MATSSSQRVTNPPHYNFEKHKQIGGYTCHNSWFGHIRIEQLWGAGFGAATPEEASGYQRAVGK